jgi:hypothetical protein
MTIKAEIRARVRTVLAETLARNVNKEVFVRALEGLVADGVQAGVTLSAQIVDSVSPPYSGISHMASYEDGYKQCLSDIKQILEDEARDS